MKKLLVVLFGWLVVAALLTPVAYADVNDFTINNFEADYTLTKDDAQGRLHIKERLDVTFTDNNHGILRAIPNDYKKHRLQLKVNGIVSPSSAPTQYTTYQSGGNTVLKIGDPNRTVTGAQSYIIDYTLSNVITFYNEYDELFWDINGDQWQQPFENVAVTVHLPKDLQLDSHQPLCYTGARGSMQAACTARYDNAMHSIVAKTSDTLLGGENLSIVAGFQKGYFQPSTWRDTLGEYAGTIIKFLIPFVAVGGVAWRNWHRYGRDAKGRGTIVPQYEAPDGLKPIEAGTIADFRTDNRDISATIIDLAIRGYLKIIETKKVLKLRKDTLSYTLRLENADFAGLKDFEVSLLKALFIKQEVGEQVELSAFKYKLATEATTLRTSLKKSLTERGYFFKKKLGDSFRFGGLLLGVFIASFIFSAFMEGAAIVGLVAGSGLATIFLLLMPARTPKGVAAREALLGLKMYMEVAEAERIKKLQAPDAAYAAKTAEPAKTVELFEKLLPFAMVLGVEQQWAKQFEHIYRTPPEWYSGNSTAFSAAYLATTLNTGVISSVNQAFSAASSSSGSGFSGGGSGGGGGGGGGGGW